MVIPYLLLALYSRGYQSVQMEVRSVRCRWDCGVLERSLQPANKVVGYRGLPKRGNNEVPGIV